MVLHCITWYCIRTLPRGGMYWEIHPQRPKRFPEGGAFAPRGPRDCPRNQPRGPRGAKSSSEGNLEGRGKSERFSEAVGFAPRGLRGAKSTAEENLEGGGDGFLNTSRVLVEHGHSLIITREGLIDNFILCSTALISPSCGSF